MTNSSYSGSAGDETGQEEYIPAGEDQVNERLANMDDAEAELRASTLRSGLDDYELDEEDAALLAGGFEEYDEDAPLLQDPVVAIVGRPNVGKSTLVNRILGRREAVVEDTPGVTRDRVSYPATWNGVNFTLVDTGGWEHDARGIHARVAGQAEVAVDVADAVLLVVDATVGITATDEAVVRMLRGKGKPVIVVANKVDDIQNEADASTLWGLGFGEPYPVSALHGRGVDALLEACYAKLPPPAPEPFGAGPEDRFEECVVAVVGRPNCGKSSFLNRALRAERVIVSDVPGTTRDPIDIPFEYDGRRYTLIDTAGVRREARVDSAVERYSRFRMQDAVERADLLVLMLDAERGVGLLDRQLAGIAAREGKSCVVAVNKWDLAKETERQFLERLAADLPFMAHCPAVFLSAKTGRGVSRVLAAVSHVARAARQTLPTGPLNRCLQEACSSNAAPSRADRPLKLHYAVQTGANPIRVRLFVNDPRRMPASFGQFLANTLRKAFDLAGVGVLLQFRARERRNPDGTPKAAPAPSNLRAARAARKAAGKARTRRRAMPRG